MRAKDAKKWVKLNRDKYIKQLHLENWTLYITIVDKNHHFQKEIDKKQMNSAGNCISYFQYQMARIKLFVKNIMDESELERAFVHELAHVATAAFRLYTNFSQHIAYISDDDRKMLQKMQQNVSELLAIQVERIILGGKDQGYTIIESEGEVTEDVLSLCFFHKKFLKYKPTIILKDKNTPQKSAEQLLWEEKKNDPEFWYKKGYEATELKVDADIKKAIGKEKQIILLKNYIGRR